MKKILSVALVVVMLLGLSVHLSAFSDTDAPVLLSVETSVATNTSVSGGDTINVTVYAQDETGLTNVQVIFIDGLYSHIRLSDFSYSGSTATASFTVPQYQASGNYYVGLVDLSDLGGNHVRYAWENYDGSDNNNPIVESMQARFTINNTSSDAEPPVLTSVTAAPTSINAPDDILITVNASDNMSGIESVWVNFRSDLDKSMSIELESNSGSWSKLVSLSQHQAAGTYSLTNVSLRDVAGNEISYANVPISNREYRLLSDHNISCSFTVNNDNGDSAPPVLIDVQVAQTDVKAPGFVTVTLKATDDRSGFNNGRVVFRHASGPEISIWFDAWHHQSDGSYQQTITLSSYQADGQYILERVFLRDKENNHSEYVADPSSVPYVNVIQLPFSRSFTVENTNVDLGGSLADPGAISSIEDYANSNGSGTIGLAYDSAHSTLPSDIFDAIEGKDIDLVLTGGDVQWVFNGNDIDSSKLKDIDLQVSITPQANYQGPGSAQIDSTVGDADAYVITFADNGALPGKAKIRLKVDVTFLAVLKANPDIPIRLYYYNSSTGRMEEKATNVTITADDFIEFYVDHNSTFVLSKGALDLGKKNDPPSSGGEWVTVSGGSGSSSSTSSSSTTGTKRNPRMGA